jgi:hypothetical protein
MQVTCTCPTGELIIANNVVEIASDEYSGCSLITSLSFEINSQVTTIGSSAFYGCSGLTSINLPRTLRSIGNEAFKQSCSPSSGCTVTFDGGNEGENYDTMELGDDVFKEAKIKGTFTLPSHVSIIGDSLFESAGLSSVGFAFRFENIYSQLTYMKDDTFKNTKMSEPNLFILPQISTHSGAFENIEYNSQSVNVYGFDDNVDGDKRINVIVDSSVTGNPYYNPQLLFNPVWESDVSKLAYEIPPHVVVLPRYMFSSSTTLSYIYPQGYYKNDGMFCLVV